MKGLWKGFACVVIVYSLMLVGCPSRSIAKAKDSSAKLARYANTGINVTRDLYQQKVIPLAHKDKIADAFIALADAGIAFDAAVARAEQVYGPNVSGSEIDKLFQVFDTQVVSGFLAVLVQLKLISDASAYGAVIDSIRAAVLIIANTFGRSKETERRLATV